VKGELIGKGTYGSVFLGLNATTGEMLAVKQVEVSRALIERDDDRSKAMIDALNAEIETLKDLDHPHIVQYLGYERTDITLSIFLEYVPGGSVGRCLKKHGRFEESVIRSLIRQVLEGLAYLHAQGRLHRVKHLDALVLTFRILKPIIFFSTLTVCVRYPILEFQSKAVCGLIV
jgi:serine/threonine protein kinase